MNCSMGGRKGSIWIKFSVKVHSIQFNSTIYKVPVTIIGALQKPTKWENFKIPLYGFYVAMGEEKYN